MASEMEAANSPPVVKINLPINVITAIETLKSYFLENESPLKTLYLDMTMRNSLETLSSMRQSVKEKLTPLSIVSPTLKRNYLSANSVMMSTLTKSSTQSTIVTSGKKPTISDKNQAKLIPTRKSEVVPLIPAVPVKIIRPNTIITKKLHIDKTKVAIIGSAGKNMRIGGDDYSLSNADASIFYKMVARVTTLINEDISADNIELVSGGAAWSDHVAVQIYLNHKQGSQSSSSTSSNKCYNLTLYLPAPFSHGNYLDTDKQHWASNPGRVSNNYHESFSKVLGDKSGLISRRQIKMAIELGANVYIRKGFHQRNEDIARSDYLYAFTWEKDAPTTGGTGHTWNIARKNGAICKNINLYQFMYTDKPYPQEIPNNKIIPMTIISTMNTNHDKKVTPLRLIPLQPTISSNDQHSTLKLEIIKPIKFVDVEYIQPDELDDIDPEKYTEKARHIIDIVMADTISADDDATMIGQLKIILHRYSGDLATFLQDISYIGIDNYVLRYDDIPTNFADREEIEELIDVINEYQNEQCS